MILGVLPPSGLTDVPGTACTARPTEPAVPGGALLPLRRTGVEDQSGRSVAVCVCTQSHACARMHTCARRRYTHQTAALTLGAFHSTLFPECALLRLPFPSHTPFLSENLLPRASSVHLTRLLTGDMSTIVSESLHPFHYETNSYICF